MVKYTYENGRKEIALNDEELVFAKVREDAIIPTKDDENAGYDIYANFKEDYVIIPPHSTKLIPTGIASAMTEKWYFNVAERGSTGSKGMKYSAGIIDSSYRGEIFIAISNVNEVEIIISKLSKEDLDSKYCEDLFLGRSLVYDNEIALINACDEEFKEHEAIIYPYSKAIAQLIVHEVPKMDVKEISYEDLKTIPSKRGVGALGSSNK